MLSGFGWWDFWRWGISKTNRTQKGGFYNDHRFFDLDKFYAALEIVKWLQRKSCGYLIKTTNPTPKKESGFCVYHIISI